MRFGRSLIVFRRRNYFPGSLNAKLNGASVLGLKSCNSMFIVAIVSTNAHFSVIW